MNGREIAEKLRAARDLMNESGKHWVQGKFQYPVSSFAEETRYCAIGAIRKVVSGDAYKNTEEAREIAAVLREQIIADGVGPDDGPLDEEEVVVLWNDSTLRTWQEVSDTFLAAAEKAEATTKGERE